MKCPRLPVAVRLAALSCLTVILACGTVSAQFDFLGDGLSPAVPGVDDKPVLEASLEQGTGDLVCLTLQLTLPPGSATYSQDPSFDKPTVITVTQLTGLEPLEDKYTPDHPPKRSYDNVFQKEVEKFSQDVTWVRRFRLRPGAAPEDVTIRGEFSHLVCNDESCRPFKHAFAVSLAGGEVPIIDAPPGDAKTDVPSEPVVFVQNITPTRRIAGALKDDPVSLTFALEPETAAPGESVTLTITMDIGEGWHSYGLERAPEQVGLPTEISVTAHNLEPAGDFSEQPETERLDKDLVHHGKVTWTREFKVAQAGTFGVSGEFRYMICDAASQCRPPKSIEFSLGHAAPAAKVVIADPQVDSIADGAITPFSLVEAAPPSSLAMNLLFAFLGGLILNVMPCVLPVIAVKVLSFVQQAGESRGRILALNAAYSGGVIVVFLLLACLAVFLGYKREDLFQSNLFNLVMAAIVFAMGLSLLGVFEIPVPGMIGSAAGAQHREGLTGAFMTGIFATLLATPCSGPFMGTTLAWSVKQTASVAFLVWGVMGVGMASPYLVLGLFPRFVSLLPKPGMWMVRFKEFCGFVLMGAVIWLISAINRDLVISTLIILVGVALGVWMVGNLYHHASPPRHKWTVRVAATALSLGICGFALRLQEHGNELAWEDFSTARVEQLRQQGKPILIDFTADWCAICKTNETTALNRPGTVKFVMDHEIVTLKADYTKEDPEIKEWLDLCKQDSVPLTLIFPANRPDAAIPLRGPYSNQTLLAKLREAVAASRESGAEQMASISSAPPR